MPPPSAVGYDARHFGGSQRWLGQREFEPHRRRHDGGLPVRGPHPTEHGEPIAEDGDFFGTAVQLAARICDRTEPGDGAGFARRG
jgi:hypothetical protein